MILRLFWVFFLKCFCKDAILPVCMLRGLYFLLHLKKAAPPSSIHDAAFFPLGTISNLIKRIQLIAMRKILLVPSPPMPSGGETWGAVDWEVREGEFITNRRPVEPTNTQSPSENNSSIHNVLAQSRVVNKMQRLSKEWQGWLNGNHMPFSFWKLDTGSRGWVPTHGFLPSTEEQLWHDRDDDVFIFPVSLKWCLVLVLAGHSDRMPLEVFGCSRWLDLVVQENLIIFYHTSSEIVLKE